MNVQIELVYTDLVDKGVDFTLECISEKDT